jgi:hypothetical protein
MRARTGHAYQYRGWRNVLRETVAIKGRFIWSKAVLHKKAWESSDPQACKMF